MDMQKIDAVFYHCFEVLFSVIHSTIVSYMVIVVLDAALIVAILQWFKRQKKAKTSVQQLSRFIMGVFALLLFAFLLWILLVHFHTYKVN